jgi:hypothetical protein
MVYYARLWERDGDSAGLMSGRLPPLADDGAEGFQLGRIR